MPTAHIALVKLPRRVDGSAQPVSDAGPVIGSQTITSFATSNVSSVVAPSAYNNLFWLISVDTPSFVAFSANTPNAAVEPRFYLPNAGQYAFRASESLQKVAVIAQ